MPSLRQKIIYFFFFSQLKKRYSDAIVFVRDSYIYIYIIAKDSSIFSRFSIRHSVIPFNYSHLRVSCRREENESTKQLGSLDARIRLCLFADTRTREGGWKKKWRVENTRARRNCVKALFLRRSSVKRYASVSRARVDFSSPFRPFLRPFSILLSPSPRHASRSYPPPAFHPLVAQLFFSRGVVTTPI